MEQGRMRRDMWMLRRSGKVRGGNVDEGRAHIDGEIEEGGECRHLVDRQSRGEKGGDRELHDEETLYWQLPQSRCSGMGILFSLKSGVLSRVDVLFLGELAEDRSGFKYCLTTGHYSRIKFPQSAAFGGNAQTQ